MNLGYKLPILERLNLQIHMQMANRQQSLQFPLSFLSLLSSGGLDKWVNSKHERIALISVGICRYPVYISQNQAHVCT